MAKAVTPAIINWAQRRRIVPPFGLPSSAELGRQNDFPLGGNRILSDAVSRIPAPVVSISTTRQTPITSGFNVPRLVCGRDTSELSTVVTAAKPESALFWGTCSDAGGGGAEDGHAIDDLG